MIHHNFIIRLVAFAAAMFVACYAMEPAPTKIIRISNLGDYALSIYKNNEALEPCCTVDPGLTVTLRLATDNRYLYLEADIINKNTQTKPKFGVHTSLFAHQGTYAIVTIEDDCIIIENIQTHQHYLILQLSTPQLN